MRLALLVRRTMLALTVALQSCSSFTSNGIEPEPITRRAEHPLVVVLTPRADAVLPVLRSLHGEVRDAYDVQVLWVAREATVSQLNAELAAIHPAVVVVLDNPTAVLYEAWARSVATPPPSAVLLAAFVEQLKAAIPNSRAIAYEIPAITALVDLRSLLSRDIGRLGVIHRRKFRNYVERQRDLAAVEKLDLTGFELRDDASPVDLREALLRLRERQVQALWVMNDNQLLTRSMLQGAWLQHTRNWAIPVVVGVPTLIDAQVHFGTYAAVADPEGLGVQAADLIASIADGRSSESAPVVELPVSVHTYLDLERARELGLREDRQSEVDFAVTARRKGIR